MDLCIKTIFSFSNNCAIWCFNPCFNGSMYKNWDAMLEMIEDFVSFNPCFNGSMYKNNTLEKTIHID